MYALLEALDGIALMPLQGAFVGLDTAASRVLCA